MALRPPEAIQGMIENAGSKPKAGIISTAFGAVALLFGAGGVVGQLQTSLNKVWGVVPKPGQGVCGFVRQRFASTMVLAVGFLLLVSLAASAFLTVLSQFMGTLIGEAAIVGHLLDIVISFVFVTVLFAMIFKILPDVRIRWKDV